MKITYTQIKAFLNRCVWNPRIPGPLKIISEIDNAEYYEQRAIEFIKEANCLNTINDLTLANYDDKIIKAVQLLALAREVRYNELKEINEKENIDI